MGSKARIMFPNASFSKLYPSTPVKTTKRSRSYRFGQSGRRARSLIVRPSQSTAYETKRLSWRDCSATGVPSRLLDTLTQKQAASELPLLALPCRSCHPLGASAIWGTSAVTASQPARGKMTHLCHRTLGFRPCNHSQGVSSACAPLGGGAAAPAVQPARDRRHIQATAGSTSSVNTALATRRCSTRGM
jgi:hypothetical protein